MTVAHAANGKANGCAPSDRPTTPSDESTTTGRLWLEEELSDGLKWSMLVKRVLHTGKSEYQTMELLDTVEFGKILLLDGKVQSSERDEYVYHELLVHPVMLHHPNPKSVFICGGGEGSTAREVLRYKSVERVVMVDIDEEVCNFCRKHLEYNQAAYADPRLTVINDDARAQLEQSEQKFDVIVGDLADPLEGGPCYQLYTDDFYRNVVLPKLNPGGLFVTQSGPCGYLSAHEVFAPIHNTLRSVFPRVQYLSEHVPSYADKWSWNIGFSDAEQRLLSAEEMDTRIAERLGPEGLVYLDGATFDGITVLCKQIREMLAAETCILTKDNPRFIYGSGNCDKPTS